MKRGKYRWSVREVKRHGISVGGVYADNYKDALQRAARIGFKNPDAVSLDEDGELFRRWRKQAGYK